MSSYSYGDYYTYGITQSAGYSSESGGYSYSPYGFYNPLFLTLDGPGDYATNSHHNGTYYYTTSVYRGYNDSKYYSVMQSSDSGSYYEKSTGYKDRSGNIFHNEYKYASGNTYYESDFNRSYGSSQLGQLSGLVINRYSTYSSSYGGSDYITERYDLQSYGTHFSTDRFYGADYTDPQGQSSYYSHDEHSP